jgi:hypothetical protein
MATVKIKAGQGECFACRREVVWRKAESGALSCWCQHCDYQGYAKHGTEAERLIMARITPVPGAEDKLPAAPGTGTASPNKPPALPADAPKMVPSKKPGVFGLAGF